MLKSVCVVHSSSLAYHGLCKNVSEVDTLIRKVSGISCFFHMSAAHTAELEKYAKEQHLNIRRFPKYYGLIVLLSSLGIDRYFIE